MGKEGLRLSEHDHQCLLLDWANQQGDPRLSLLFAIPNGGHRHISVAIRMRREGVKAGVPDLFLPVAVGSYHGLFLEIKAPGGKVSALQRSWLKRLEENGYRAAVCWGWEMARDELIDYLGL